ncbi:MAG: hypothetical protein IPP19_15295 [Verrucomicrobia bacterium]|nr:hypothetical protein [Verrucomicrobiota bacterium]
MDKITTIVCALAIGGIVWFFVAPKPSLAVPDPMPKSEEEAEDKLPKGPILYVVVDFDGAYVDTQRIDFSIAKQVISTLVRDRKINTMVVYGTDLARHGDVVSVYTGIEPGLLRWKAISSQTLPSGSRKPATGFLKPQCCHSIDVDNHVAPEAVEEPEEVKAISSTNGAKPVSAAP